MAEENNHLNIFSNNDTLDINELASLNDDISADFIEQLQNQVAKNASEFTGKPLANENTDSELFEEVEPQPTADSNIIEEPALEKTENDIVNAQNETSVVQDIAETLEKETPSSNTNKVETAPENVDIDHEINNLTGGNIIEKPITEKQIEYNQSLDYLDDNVKYSKYIVYINPENKDFIDSLTVKERKNLINRLLREQDDITITKRRLSLIQTIIRHCIISIITIAITIPIAYWTINASLEATINNYRRSKTIFNTLYKEKGKIKTNIQH